MLNKNMTHKNFTMLSEIPFMDDPAQYTTLNIDHFARELAVALRRILGIAEGTNSELPTVTGEEYSQTTNQEAAND